MTDVFSKAKRSEVMSRIRSTGNKDTELALIAFFRRHHIAGWRRRMPLFGKPDFVFPSERLAVFIDGCFWHDCPKHGKRPKINAGFWAKKFAANRARDKKVTSKLRSDGWRVLRIWEHALTTSNERSLLARLRRSLAP